MQTTQSQNFLEHAQYWPYDPSKRVEGELYYLHQDVSDISTTTTTSTTDEKIGSISNKYSFFTWRKCKQYREEGIMIPLCSLHGGISGSCQECNITQEESENIILCKYGKTPNELCVDCMKKKYHLEYDNAFNLPNNTKYLKNNTLYKYGTTVVYYMNNTAQFVCSDHANPINQCVECCNTHYCYYHHPENNEPITKRSCNICNEMPVHMDFRQAQILPKLKKDRNCVSMYQYQTTVVYHTISGKLICKDHHKNVVKCLRCYGGLKCEHNNKQYFCIKCAGNLCSHGTISAFCNKCYKKHTCYHGIIRRNCQNYNNKGGERTCDPEENLINNNTTVSCCNILSKNAKERSSTKVYDYIGTKVIWDKKKSKILCNEHKVELYGCVDCSDMPVHPNYKLFPSLPKKTIDRKHKKMYSYKGSVVYQKKKEKFIRCQIHDERFTYCNECSGGKLCEHKKPMYFCRQCSFEKCGHVNLQTQQKLFKYTCNKFIVFENGKRSRFCKHGKKRIICNDQLCHKNDGFVE